MEEAGLTSSNQLTHYGWIPGRVVHTFAPVVRYLAYTTTGLPLFQCAHGTDAFPLSISGQVVTAADEVPVPT